MKRGAALAEAFDLEQARSGHEPLPPAPVAAAAAPARGGSLSPALVLALQRSAGNASVARLVADALPAGLVDSLTGVQQTADAAESSAVGEAERLAGAAGTALTEAPQALEGGLAAVEAPHSRAATAQGEEASQRTALVEADAKKLEEAGNRAGQEVDAAAPVAPSLLSPARAIVEPASVAADAGRLDALGSVAGLAAGGGVQAAPGGASAAGPGPVGAAGLGAGGQVQAALGASAQPEWNVDLAEVVGAAGGMRTPQIGGAVPMAERRSGDERIAQVTAFAEQLGGRVSNLAHGLDSGLGDMSRQAAEGLRQKAAGLAGTATDASKLASDGFEAVKRALVGDVDAAANRQAAGVEQQADQARTGVNGVVDQAKNKLAGAAQSARGMLGGLGSTLMSLLPGPLSGLTSGIDEARGRVDARQISLLPRLGELARQAKDGIVSAAKSFADSKLRQWVTEERVIQQALAGAKLLAETVGKAVSSLVPPRLKAIGAQVEAAAEGELSKLRIAAQSIVDKLRDGACVVLEKAGGPYVRQYLPDLNNQINNSVRITATTDLIVPLEEFGIPANLKVAAGAGVEVSVLDGVYTVKVNGEAALLANELVGTEAHGGVTSTGPVLTPTQQAFGKLGGGGAAPAVAAKIGDSVVDAGTSAADAASPGGTRGEIDAGLKGSVRAEWRFDAKSAQTSCDGVGGMLTLLGGLGASAALPSPFNQLAGGAVFESFMPNLQSCRFSVGGTVQGDVDIKTGGIADIKARGGVEAMENIDLVKKDGKLVSQRTRTIQADLDASAVAGLASGSFAKYRAFIAAEGIARLTLIYEPGTDEVLPTSLGGAVALSIGAKNFEPSLIPEEFGTEVPEIRRILTGSFPGIDGPREVKVTLTLGRVYENLEPLGRELKAYLAGPLEKITVDGVLEIVSRNFATLTPTDHVKLTVSQTQRKELDVGGVIGEGAAAGADVDVTAEHTLSKTWVTYSGEDEVVDLAAGRARPAAQVIEPDDKKKKDKKGKPQFPTGLTSEDPIDMIWAKPPDKYAEPIDVVDRGVEKKYTHREVRSLNGRNIGIPGFFPAVGEVFKRGRFKKRQGEETEFKKHLERADFRHEGVEGWTDFAPDHVMDVAYGGDDAFLNLWPLDKATNGRAGDRHTQGQTVVFSFKDDTEDDPPRLTTLSRTDPRAPKGPGVPKDALDRGHENIFFRIVDTATEA